MGGEWIITLHTREENEEGACRLRWHKIARTFYDAEEVHAKKINGGWKNKWRRVKMVVETPKSEWGQGTIKESERGSQRKDTMEMVVRRRAENIIHDIERYKKK